MKNNYFLTYGFANSSDDIDSIILRLESIFGLSFSKRYSDFLGEYFLGKSDVVSRMTIEQNYVEYLEEWKEVSHKNSAFLMKVSFMSLDKLRKEDVIDTFCKEIENSFKGAFMIKSREIPV